MFLFRCICGNFLVKKSYSLTLNVKLSEGELLVCLVYFLFLLTDLPLHTIFQLGCLNTSFLITPDFQLLYRSSRFLLNLVQNFQIQLKSLIFSSFKYYVNTEIFINMENIAYLPNLQSKQYHKIYSKTIEFKIFFF